MKAKQIALSILTKTKTGKKIICNQRYRIVLSAAIAFVFNLLYALYHGILGILNLSFWFIAMCAFYGIFAVMRFSAVLCEYGHRKKHLPSNVSEQFVMKLSGILLTVLSIVLATVIYISLSQNIAAKHEEIIMLTIATYTFYKITIAVIRAVKQHKNASLLLKTIRSISYAEVAASILTLQRSMLVSFGEMEQKQVQLMSALTGAGAFLFVLILGISLIIKSSRKENNSWQNQNS